MTAGGAPTAPASPAPLTPSGFAVEGTLWTIERMIIASQHRVKNSTNSTAYTRC